jgi:Leu/Phe-tRNA-protein transferase
MMEHVSSLVTTRNKKKSITQSGKSLLAVSVLHYCYSVCVSCTSTAVQRLLSHLVRDRVQWYNTLHASVVTHTVEQQQV